jgi:hypothetical protein
MKRYLIPAAAVFLAGCSNQVVNQCPSAGVLSDTAILTVFRAGAPADPSGEAYTATINTVKSSCEYAKGASTADAAFTFTVRVVRAPSPDGATYVLPYYFAITQGDRILNKRNATLKITFAPGSAEASDEESLPNTILTLEPGHPPTDYELLVGFQLSDAERAYNQKRGRYTP